MARVSDLVNGLRTPSGADEAIAKVASIPSEKAVSYIQQVIAPAAYEDYTLVDYVNTVPEGRNVPVQAMIIGGRNNSMSVTGGEVDFDYASYVLSTTEKYGGGGNIPDGLRWGFMRGHVNEKDGYKLSQGRRVVRPVTPLDWFVMPKADGLGVDIDNVLHKPKGVTTTPSGKDMPLFNIYLSDVTTGGLAHDGEEEKHNAIRRHLAKRVWDLFGKGATELCICGIVSCIRWDGNTSGAMEIIVPVWALYAKRIQQHVNGGFDKTFGQIKDMMGGVSRADIAKGLGLAKNASKLKLKQAFNTYDENWAPHMPNHKPASTPMPTNPAPKQAQQPTPPPPPQTNNPPVATPPSPVVTETVSQSGPLTMEDLERIAKNGNVSTKTTVVNNVPASTTPATISTSPPNTPASNAPYNPLGAIGNDITEDEVESINAEDIPTAGSKGGLG